MYSTKIVKMIETKSFEKIRLNKKDCYGIIGFDNFQDAQKFAVETGGVLAKFKLEFKEKKWKCFGGAPDRGFTFKDFYKEDERLSTILLLHDFGYNVEDEDDFDLDESPIEDEVEQALSDNTELMQLVYGFCPTSFAIGVILPNS